MASVLVDSSIISIPYVLPVAPTESYQVKLILNQHTTALYLDESLLL